jgi:glycolate oxidase
VELSGGVVPVLVVSFYPWKRLNRILEIDKENLMVTVEPGLITGDNHRAEGS